MKSFFTMKSEWFWNGQCDKLSHSNVQNKAWVESDFWATDHNNFSQLFSHKVLGYGLSQAE